MSLLFCASSSFAKNNIIIVVPMQTSLDFLKFVYIPLFGRENNKSALEKALGKSLRAIS